MHPRGECQDRERVYRKAPGGRKPRRPKQKAETPEAESRDARSRKPRRPKQKAETPEAESRDARSRTYRNSGLSDAEEVP
jgi:hypothetical protein